MFALERQGAVNVIRPHGALEAKCCEEFKRVVLQGLGGGRPMIVVDLHDVPLIDGAGLEALVDLRDALEARGGAVKLAAVNPLCADILRVTGVGPQFEQFPQSRAAVGSFAV
ncbi:MAG: STAS domain-containing protein [Pirellulales bacterium]|nr:STAS domain-containing protein [Pirellulales bacterium]